MSSSSSASGEIPESKEVGLHQAVVGIHGLSNMAEDAFKAGLRISLLQGKQVIILVIDPNKGKIENSHCSAPELKSTVTDLTMLCESKGSQMEKDCEKILG